MALYGVSWEQEHGRQQEQKHTAWHEYAQAPIRVMNTESADLEDTHLCIKCNATIVGLSKYIEHRKRSCLSTGGNEHLSKQVVTPATTSAATEQVSHSDMRRSNLDHTYDGFHFAEPEAPSSYLRKTASSHGGKTSKSLTDSYDPTYELGADLFFSSLQLQSVSTGGKTGARPERGAKEEQSWHTSSNCSDPLLKLVREHEVTHFKSLKFVHSPEASEEEDDDEDFEGDDDEHEHEHEQEHDPDPDPEPDEDYDGRRHSPPTVPATHTGGKWKPEHRPQLQHTHLERISPSWDEPPEEQHDHPPAEHTHGKWVPGSKQLEYRENIDLTKLQQPGASYWCNICCRRLKTRLNYEQHLRSAYHQRRADAERQLEQANLPSANLTLTTKDFSQMPPTEQLPRRRRRRAHFLRCDLCRHSMARHLMGKHLISHYHYRRLQQQQPNQLRRQSALHDILEHMGSIVRQAPFQCLPCRFYANTEQSFQLHWRSSTHVTLTERLGGSFWCSYCQFECASNEEMWQHLLGSTHKEVLFAINRSVPVCIAQRRPLSCSSCSASFLYNAQLRRHLASEHVELVAAGSAADDYQCRFRCGICGVAQRSRVALQRHEKHQHRLAKYYCAVCRLEFETPLEARRHRSLMQHKRRACRQLSRKCSSSISSNQPDREIQHMLHEVLEEQQPAAAGEQPSTFSSKRRRLTSQCVSCPLSFETPQALVQHRRELHPVDNHACLSCGSSFQSAQALGRHTRCCQPTASTSTAVAAPAPAPAPAAAATTESKSWNCAQCSFTAQYESDLLYHRFFHTHGSAIGKNELLQCPLCPKQFRKHSLRPHLRNHTDERIFECVECSAKFARRHNLKNHIATVHGQKEKPSPAADKSAVQQSKVVAKQKYQCGTCGKILAKK
ncbi:GH12884 [Drosophila grimshawi]|uniref:GH12884 n=1 Tax=Drosophila grimshawi TaxID=7222 RepID=B4K1M1_DROGR|nr:GH12884 [Drosophila grimshawi]